MADVETGASGDVEIKVVVFDYGGVFGQSSLSPPHFRDAVDDERWPEVDAIKKASWAKFKVDPDYPLEDYWAPMLAALDRPEGRTTESMTQAVLDGLRLNVGVVALQQRLVRHGYLTGMISNHALPFFEEIIRRHCLLEFFDDESLVVASYMDSVRSAKPEARIFECFLERLAASEAGGGLSASDCVFIDDKEANVEAARALGFHGIWFNAKLHTVERLTAGLIALGVDAAERLPELAA